jgi:hypothetical protein
MPRRHPVAVSSRRRSRSIARGQRRCLYPVDILDGILILRSDPDETERLFDRRSLSAVAAWAARQMPAAGAVTAAERALWLAAIGVAQDAFAWGALQADILPPARAPAR